MKCESTFIPISGVKMCPLSHFEGFHQSFQSDNNSNWTKCESTFLPIGGEKMCPLRHFEWKILVCLIVEYYILPKH